ncbi:histidine triad nucleotide-binding protein [Bacteriovorax sp. DB6_IX]|uniref:histidine triad nucleotide-binding protein n=1 Tax=Bacteriovorax sp. DB6_IX TaxID=1353530 RepID=UPI00038A4B41|nr:histidine triad nucleotide-binding protein [Bacteriovorax sp. DB6_IX]EQC51915.1 scavenger mRNA decapping enzyme [Bacteriovorax sp. DB6_IX]
MSDCLFCKILAGEIPSSKVYEDEKVVGFKDIQPQAKEHYLFIHREHTANVNEISENSPEQLADIFQGISKFTKSNELEKNGFRVVTNLGPHGCQTVFHTHFHVLGGEQLRGFGS